MATVKIEGMSCQHCVASVKDALEKIPGVSAVTVELDKKQAQYKGEVDAEAVKAAIIGIGFDVVS